MFPSTSERETLAQQIGLTSRQVQVWFQNQRQKRRRERETDDAVHTQLLPDLLGHSMGWPTSAIPVHPSQARITRISASYPPPPHGPPPNYHLASQTMLPTRALTHPPLYRHERPPDDFQRGLSDSQIPLAGRHITSDVPSAWRHPSSRSGSFSGAHAAFRGYDRSDEFVGASAIHESHIGPLRRPRSMSTSQQLYRWASQVDNSPPSSRDAMLGSSMPAHSAYAHADGLSTEQWPQDDRYDRYVGSTNPGIRDQRDSNSAPARESQLPPSLMPMVIDSPRAGPEAITLQPLHFRASQVNESMAASSPLSDRAFSPRARPRPHRRASSDCDDGQGSSQISVADLIN
ncbi:hypothetical protein CC85DRAFT_108158 [Cutaneotrichosporon oleaginosum]|uniref:Homeobox domain-containing protein n=1 Tax=Cutaneotrichosporon oleaginosum TaxID=879819 RepID=A0A0J0XKT5_9TREE|nr:uncharacterized protein CC85DRAFT_108158 [Cutaneotrichosporon oleaginosum]KLT41682.1 hypothetical protein CC85DRAFT_108158 [Cutaneotrichosporon oleaginosum]TXT08054.1 hypothetical protein COLE_04978 [Cutaneotrichosporon oleaginosum]